MCIVIYMIGDDTEFPKMVVPPKQVVYFMENPI